MSQLALSGSPVEPSTLIIFGGLGDLAQKKLFPALFELFQKKLLSPQQKIVAVGRRNFDQEEAQSLAVQNISAQPAEISKFRSLIQYVPCDCTKKEDARRLREVLVAERLNWRLVFYMALKPELFEAALINLRDEGLLVWQETQSRFLLEKPFGVDLVSSSRLTQLLSQFLPEDAIFRIDHYLAKEQIQSMLVLRQSNPFLDTILDKAYISHIQLTVAEDIGIEGRGEYFESAGIVRDMFQNHLLQVLSICLMENPFWRDSSEMSYEKIRALKNLRVWHSFKKEEVLVRAQYESGFVKGYRVRGYREEDKVKPFSQVETFFAGCFECLSPRWVGVPIFVRVGKRLPKRIGMISFFFKRGLDLDRELVAEYPSLAYLSQQALRIEFQPREKVSLFVNTKIPGLQFQKTLIPLSFNLPQVLGEYFKDPYSRVLYDALCGNRVLFPLSEEVNLAWQLVDEIRAYFNKDIIPLRFYPSGSWGPAESDKLINRFKFNWERL